MSLRKKIVLFMVVAAIAVVLLDNQAVSQRIAETSYTLTQGWQQEWVDREIPEEEWPVVRDNPYWEVLAISRLSACDNRPGYGRFYVWILDGEGKYLGDVKVGFDTVPSEGQAYDHPNVFGVTGTRPGNRGYLWWMHLKIPTQYQLFVEDVLLIDRIRTDLGYEYCNPGSVVPWSPRNWRPVNKGGVYSYRIFLRRVEGM